MFLSACLEHQSKRATPTGFTVHRCSSLPFCLVRAWFLCPNLTPPLRRPCAGVSGSVGCAPIPSSICPAVGALVCGRPSSLLAAFKLLGIALAHSRQADASPSEVWEAKANLGPDNQLFPSSEKVLPTRQFLPYSDNLYCIHGRVLFVGVCVLDINCTGEGRLMPSIVH
ncbi:hypothetical protein TIFTF001_012265 [Ficus carica]|uniref:Uncharacterized protein n=1 Tax=Ficus carica TaxID=3494 RepID=A0AA88A009_FICCA|nr:hypothetical protein TIFTF001_012265 [Ficus carica]